MNVQVRPQQPAASLESMDPRTLRLLRAPILPLLIRMSIPNMIVMVAQAAVGLIETWWVARLGTDALSGMALVFPVLMMTQMLSAGAIGGGISSAIARALGSGRRSDANAYAYHAVIVNCAFGIAFSLTMLLFGRELYAAMGGSEGSLDAALTYSNIVFAGNIFVWLTNAFASILRGSGNMSAPAWSITLSIVLLIPLSPLLIYGLGPLPGFGLRGAGFAVISVSAINTIYLLWYLLRGTTIVRIVPGPLRSRYFGEILRIGAVAAINTLLTTLIMTLATAMIGAYSGPAAIAGFGTGARLEYLLVPLVFGLGAPLVAMVGANIGARQHDRALQIALTGSALAFGLTEAVGLFAFFLPHAWISLFDTDVTVVATGSLYLTIVGPAYGFFGLGLSLYFASQGAGRLFWPVASGFVRLVIAIGGGWLALKWTGSLTAVFIALSGALVVYGLTVLIAVIVGGTFASRRP